MDQNVGDYDRTIRLGLGVGLLIIGVLALTGLFGSVSSMMMGAGIVLALVGAILAVTGLTQTCPLYSVLDMDTT